jgi:Rrf2 family protein
MLDLAQNGTDGCVALKDIAERQNISKKYLEQIMALLNRQDVIKTVRGAQGGYKLARTPDRYTVAEILKLAEGSLAPVDELDDPSAPQVPDWQLMYVWQGLYKAVNEYLEGITLQDILDHNAQGFDYII